MIYCLSEKKRKTSVFTASGVGQQKKSYVYVRFDVFFINFLKSINNQLHFRVPLNTNVPHRESVRPTEALLVAMFGCSSRISHG